MRGATAVSIFASVVSTFQSTHPMRGATVRHAVAYALAVDFNPRTPCGVRLLVFRARFRPFQISIHAPHAGCDAAISGDISSQSNFNPRTPCGVRPTSCTLTVKNYYDFNPRTPCGVRLYGVSTDCEWSEFQSTHPMRGATCIALVLFAIPKNFNPRTPCGVRPAIQANDTANTQFQSTHPMRGATL